jgi:hypothetical protein
MSTTFNQKAKVITQGITGKHRPFHTASARPRERQELLWRA